LWFCSFSDSDFLHSKWDYSSNDAAFDRGSRRVAARSCSACFLCIGRRFALVGSPHRITAFASSEGGRFSQWPQRSTALSRLHHVTARGRIAPSGHARAWLGPLKWQRGHVPPPVAALGGHSTSPLSLCQQGSAGQCAQLGFALRRQGVGSLAHRAGAAVACGSAGHPRCSWHWWHSHATGPASQPCGFT
jgi:hypothetical protein